MNIIQITGKHSPLLAAALEHNKPVEINPENVKTAINELLKVALQEYTNRIVENVKTKQVKIPTCNDHTPYWGACVSCGRVDNPDILIGEKVDEESITSQLPEFLKEIGI